MASMQNFRSALNGFNRDDVVHYLEYANGKHEKQCALLREQITELQEELEQTRAQITLAPEEDDSEQIEQLTQRCASLEQENTALRQQLSSAPAEADLAALREQLSLRSRECEQLQQALAAKNRQLEQALTEQKTLSSRAEEELAAYRRAERTERIAQVRASQIYDQANAALADASAELDSAMQTLKQVTDDTVCQIQAMQSAVVASKTAFTAAETALRCIRPKEEE